MVLALDTAHSLVMLLVEGYVYCLLRNVAVRDALLFKVV